MAMIFAQEANWAAAMPPIMGYLAAIVGAICGFGGLWIKSKRFEARLDKSEKEVAECKAMCNACEEDRKADQVKHAAELAKRDEEWNTDPPSWNSGGKEISEKVSHAMQQDIPVSPKHYWKIVENVRKRRLDSNERK